MRDMKWTDEQVAAITADADVLLSASAGTGKTTTIVGKILWLLGLPVGSRGSTGEPLPRCSRPCTLDRIAAITFTEKAAYDLKKKLRSAIEESERGGELRWELDRASVGTIHSFCGELLRDHALRLGIDPTFRVLDERETLLRQDEIIRAVILKALDTREPDVADFVERHTLAGSAHSPGSIDHVRAVFKEIRWHAHRWQRWTREEVAESESVPGRPVPPRVLDVDRLREIAREAGVGEPSVEPGNDERSADTAVVDAGPGLADMATLYRLAYRALGDWLTWLEAENVRDFDSLILDARRLLTGPATAAALASLRRRYRILIIDEFQDTDNAQREIAFALADLSLGTTDSQGGVRPQLFLVGDPKQSIYRFRGADIGVWNAVRGELLGNREPLRLTHNFRSEPAVVAFVNQVCGRALRERAEALGLSLARSRVEYEPLVPAVRPVRGAAGLDWLAVDEAGNRAETQEAVARRVGSRVRQLIGRALVRGDDGTPRRCRPSDIAILARNRKILSRVESGLRAYGIRSYNTAAGGLAERQEILDLVTALRVMANPYDNLSVFAYLRSPFVGLRDEVLARIQLDPGVCGRSTLCRAEEFLEGCGEGGEGEVSPGLEIWPAPESPLVAPVERRALAVGLEAIRRAHALVDRADADELLEEILERTGYRLHLYVRADAGEAVANIERFLSLLAEYRHLPLGSFLDLWARWDDRDMGIPQASLASAGDDVVTLSTIHTAKGLEWPVVVLADMGARFHRGSSRSFACDRELGPVFMPKKAERGPRDLELAGRDEREEHAEEARLLYVAMTRARDRLVIVAPTGTEKELAGYARWLGAGLEGAIEEHEARARELAASGRAGVGGAALRAASPSATSDDEATRTGRQLDAFGFDHEGEGKEGQFDLFAVAAAGRAAGPGADGDGAMAGGVEPSERPVVIYRRAEPVQGTLQRPPVTLAWLDGIHAGPWPELVRPIPLPELNFMSSATELQMRERSPDEWALRYRHGVEPARRFAPKSVSVDGLPAAVRGNVIHGVLERIEEECELARILGETIAGLDAADLEERLAPDGEYRRQLEEEIAAVVRSDAWRWYVEGENYRELQFVHLVGPRAWRHGAFDLYRPVPPAEAPSAAWIIDFKTHQIEAAKAKEVAREYEVQVSVYREAAAAILGIAPGGSDGGGSGSRARVDEVRVALHFTHPNLAVRMTGEVSWK